MERTLILLRFLGIFIHNKRPFMCEELYLHQIFTDCVFNQYTHFAMSIFQMWLQVMEPFWWCFCEFPHIINNNSYLKFYIFTIIRYVDMPGATLFSMWTLQMWLQVMERHLVFFCEFLHIINNQCCIFTKLS